MSGLYHDNVYKVLESIEEIGIKVQNHIVSNMIMSFFIKEARNISLGDKVFSLENGDLLELRPYKKYAIEVFDFENTRAVNTGKLEQSQVDRIYKIITKELMQIISNKVKENKQEFGKTFVIFEGTCYATIKDSKVLLCFGMGLE